MKKQLLFLLTIVLSTNCYSQITFEKGYYIDNFGQKVDCFIKNVDWVSNPFEFEYKITESSDKQKATITSVKEFGVYNISKHVRANVKIDRSGNRIGEMSSVKEPVFKEEELFLKVLVQGKANLYLYKYGNLNRYFYSKDSSEIEQLIFKNYLTPDGEIGKNEQFKLQLWNDLRCSTLMMSKIQKMDYKKGELVSFFVEYNKCNNEEFVSFEKKERKQKKDLFNLTIRPGFNSSSLSIENSVSNSGDTDFDNESGFRFGIEAELIMPFNKNKWAIIIEPTYQYFKSEKELATQNVEVDYRSVELPFGLRHYFFLNADSKIFINGSFVIDITGNSSIEFDSERDLEIETGTNLLFGLGYKYDDRYSLEFRYQTSRQVLTGYSFWDSDYNTLSIIFGYSLF